MKAGKLFTYALIFLLLIIPSQLLAQGNNIRIGNLKIIPGITVQTIYDDNIYMKNGNSTPGTTDRDKVSDWIYHVKPSLLFNYTFPERGFLNLGYQGDWALYNDKTSNNWKNNKGSLELDYKAPGGLILGINELFQSSEDPYGSPDQYAVGRATKRWDNDLKTKVGYLFSDNFRSFLYYNNYKQQYQNAQDDSQNYYDNEFGVGFEAKFLPKTWGFFRYNYGTRVFTADSIPSNVRADSNWHKTSVGLTWDAAAKLSGELNFGYQWKTYDNEASATATRRDKNRNTWVAATSVNFKPLETTTISLNIARTTRDSGSDTGEYFEDTGLGLSLQQTILRKFVFNVGGMYSKNEYNTKNTTGNVNESRKDDNYTANIGLDYKIKEWITVGVAYNYKEKASSDSVNDYKDNQFVATLKLVY